MSAWLADVIYRRRFLLSGLIILGALILGPRAQITRIDNDLTAWFTKTDPIYQDYERLRHEFGGSRTLIIAFEGDGLFTEPALEYLRRVSQAIELVPTVDRVHGLPTATIVEATPPTGDAVADGDGGGIEVNPLIAPSGPIDADLVKARAIGDPMLRGDLVSNDGRTVAFFITFDEDRIDALRGRVLDDIQRIVRTGLPDGVRAHFNGSIEISETYNRVTLANMERFTPLILGCTIAALYLMFRSARKTALVVFAIFISIAWTVGLYMTVGFSYNVLSSMIVPLVVVLAIADDVHIAQHFGEVLRETNGDKEAAFKASIRHLTVPLLAASGTTALGMLSLATSHVYAVRTFGIGAAMGVMIDFAISIVLVPTLLSLGKPDLRPPPQERWLMRPMTAIARFACARPRTVLAVAAVLAAIATAGMYQLRVDTNHINFFAKRHPLSQSADVIDRQLSGVYNFVVYFEGPPDSMRDPEVLARMDRYTAQLAVLPNVRKITSILDYIKRANRELHDGSIAEERLPSSRELIAQELLVLGLSDDGRRELERVVSSDFSRAQITVRLASMSSDIVFEQVNEADRLAQAAFAGTGVTPTVTGSGRLFAQLDHYLVMSQISSFGTAFFTVFTVIFVIFRSFRFGLLAIVPNLFPVIAVLGAMGWLDISMNVATVMVASVALGIVDDDTIHFISRYRRDVASGSGTDEAILAATTHEGRAAITTALINSCAFSTLLLSEYRPTAWFGGLLALTMVVAFLAEVFILPATIKLLPRFFAAERLRRPHDASRAAAAL